MVTNEAYAAAVEQQSSIARELARANALNEQLVAALRELLDVTLECTAPVAMRARTLDSIDAARAALAAAEAA